MTTLNTNDKKAPLTVPVDPALDERYNNDFPDPTEISEEDLDRIMDMLDEEEEVKKFNPYHDEEGKFTTADNAIPPMGVRYPSKPGDKPLQTSDMTGMMENYPEQSMERFTLREGEEYTVPDKPPAIVLKEQKQCFMNSTKIALGIDHGSEVQGYDAKGGYDYVEGFVMDSRIPFPIHHAWLTEKGSNKVIDPTLGWLKTGVYHGVKLDNQYLLRKVMKNKYYGVFTNGWRPDSLLLGEDDDFNYKDRAYYDKG